MLPGRSRECTILNRIKTRVFVPSTSSLKLGIGDDCAVFRPGGREDLLFTTDMLLEDIHFRRETHSAADVGHKALARGLSDIAAMGGAPRFCLLSLAVPRWADQAWVDRFYSGFLELADKTATPLAGGDLASAERFCGDVIVCGGVPRDGALLRSGAKPGDGIFVSGRLGVSALGLAKGRGRPWKRHLRPEPRLALGRFLRERLHATAAMDLSDGLSLDLNRMCAASRVWASIEQPPVYPGATLDQALHGGEDYELLFTLPPAARPPASFEGLELTRIGTVQKVRKPGDSSSRILLDGKPLPPLGFDHFHNS